MMPIGLIVRDQFSRGKSRDLTCPSYTTRNSLGAPLFPSDPFFLQTVRPEAKISQKSAIHLGFFVVAD
jgi:hypothetical protein